MLTPDPTATPAPASDVRPRRDNTSPVVLTADMFKSGFSWVVSAGEDLKSVARQSGK